MSIKKNRINKKKDFEKIFKNGKSAKGSFLVLKFLPNKIDVNRFAFIVSKKVSTKSVVRNKIRRRLSESVKDFVDEKNNTMDFIFIALPKIKAKNFWEIKEEVKSLLKK